VLGPEPQAAIFVADKIGQSGSFSTGTFRMPVAALCLRLLLEHAADAAAN
jgi:hypothetical protein